MVDPKYARCSVEEFSLDTSFKEAVLRRDAAGRQFLADIVRAFPEQKESVREARDLILQINRSFGGDPLLPSEARTRMYENIRKRGSQGRPLSLPWRKNRLGLLSLAATLLVLLVAGIVYFSFPASEEQTFRTAYGETAEIRLPDGSMVTLNANSALRFVSPWPEGKPREVWLDGEGFFDVTSMERSKTTFTVHTKGPDVVVLGTRFNVETRRERTRVVLEEGAVRLDNPVEQDLNIPEKNLKPGDMAEYKPESGLTVRTEEKPEIHSSWKDGYLPIEGYTFPELLDRIESLYGVSIEVGDAIQKPNRVTGVLPTRNLDETIATLEILYGVKVERREKRLIIKLK